MPLKGAYTHLRKRCPESRNPLSLSQYVTKIENAIAAERDTYRRGALVEYKRHVEVARDEQHNETMELAAK